MKNHLTRDNKTNRAPNRLRSLACISVLLTTSFMMSFSAAYAQTLQECLANIPDPDPNNTCEVLQSRLKYLSCNFNTCAHKSRNEGCTDLWGTQIDRVIAEIKNSGCPYDGIQ